MEKFKYLFMSLLVALVSMTVVSCGDDDDDATSSNPLVGTWVETYGSNTVTITTFTFTKSGTGVRTIRKETSNGVGITADPESFTYAYDDNSKNISIKFDGSNLMTRGTATVTGSNLVLSFGDGNSELEPYYQLIKKK